MTTQKLRKLYWINPVYIYAFWIFLVIYAYTIPNKDLQTLFQTSNYVSLENVIIYLFFFLVFCLGCLCAKHSHFEPYVVDETKEIKAYKILFYLYLFANLIWFINLYFTYGSDILISLLYNLTGYYNMFKDDGGRVSGITTFTEIGIVAAPYGFYLLKKTSNKWIKKSLVIIFVLNTLRSFIFAERIAVLEIALPCFAIWILFYKGKHWNFFKMIPIFAIVFLFVFFGLFEYFRSWAYYKDVYNGTFINFIINRVIVGYYTISVNNECLYLNKGGCNYFPLEILEWLWLLPGFNTLAAERAISTASGVSLADYANPEFNNLGGLLSCYTDLGFFGVIPQFIFGYIVYKAYRGYLLKKYIYAFIYAISLYALLELPRYFFWGSGKAFFCFIGLIIIRYIVIRKA